MSRIFLDTNVVCYVRDAKSPAKQRRAEELVQALVASRDIPIVSTQVLQEFYNTLTIKFKIPAAEAKTYLLELNDLTTVIVTPTIIYSAADLHKSASISFRDALIVAAAQAANCDELWSEDLQEGRRFGKLRVVNPFMN